MTASAADWPTWRNTDRSGKSAETGLLKAWPENGPTKLWENNDLGSGFSTVIMVNDRLYTTGHKDNRLYLHAISADGETLWSQDIGVPFTASHPGSRSTPAFDNGRLYLVSGVGVVGCYSAEDGETLWTRTFQEFGASLPRWGFAESPLVLGDLVIVTPGGDACMVALNKETGETVWQSEKFADAHYASPIFITFNDVPMIVNGTRGGLIAVHAETGAILWTHAFATSSNANCATPAYSDGHIFWAVGYRQGAVCVRLVADGDAVKVEEAYKSPDMVCHHGGFIIHEGHVYGNHNNGYTCMDLKTGEVKWFENAVGKGSLCFADGMLYLFGERGGRAGLGPASPDGFALTGDFNVQGQGTSWAYPVVANGRLLLRYDTNLYCFDVKAD